MSSISLNAINRNDNNDRLKSSFCNCLQKKPVRRLLYVFEVVKWIGPEWFQSPSQVRQLKSREWGYERCYKGPGGAEICTPAPFENLAVRNLLK